MAPLSTALSTDMTKTIPNPKKKGVNLTLTEEELEELRRAADRTGHKPTPFATILYRRAMRALKGTPSLEEFLDRPAYWLSSAQAENEGLAYLHRCLEAGWNKQTNRELRENIANAIIKFGGRFADEAERSAGLPVLPSHSQEHNTSVNNEESRAKQVLQLKEQALGQPTRKKRKSADDRF